MNDALAPLIQLQDVSKVFHTDESRPTPSTR